MTWSDGMVGKVVHAVVTCCSVTFFLLRGLRGHVDVGLKRYVCSGGVVSSTVALTTLRSMWQVCAPFRRHVFQKPKSLISRWERYARLQHRAVTRDDSSSRSRTVRSGATRRESNCTGIKCSSFLSISARSPGNNTVASLSLAVNGKPEWLGLEYNAEYIVTLHEGNWLNQQSMSVYFVCCRDGERCHRSFLIFRHITCRRHTSPFLGSVTKIHLNSALWKIHTNRFQDRRLDYLPIIHPKTHRWRISNLVGLSRRAHKTQHRRSTAESHQTFQRNLWHDLPRHGTNKNAQRPTAMYTNLDRCRTHTCPLLTPPHNPFQVSAKPSTKRCPRRISWHSSIANIGGGDPAAKWRNGQTNRPSSPSSVQLIQVRCVWGMPKRLRR